jgi:coenzyme F420 hydrogenase subunit beta
MVVEAPGFNRPRIERTVDTQTDAVIAGSCPGSIVAPWSAGPQSHEYWGPYQELRTGHATDERLRHTASSGGVLSALLLYALEEGLVDGVVEVGPDPDRPTGNRVVISTSAADIFNGAGSRYAPSSPLQQLDVLLERKDRLAFVGKPCDVSALRLYGRFDDRVAQRFPLVLSFFCAGVPSLDRSDAVVRKLGFEPDSITFFRYRGEGWPGEASAVGKDGSERRMSYADSWGGVLAKEVQFRCKICPDAVGGSADLVCADAWYADEAGYPAFDDLPGRSLVIARTRIGAELLRNAVASGAIKIDEDHVEPTDIDRMQPGQTKKKRLVRARTSALRLMFRPIPVMKDLCVDQAARRAQMAEICRNFLGMIRRVLMRKL